MIFEDFDEVFEGEMVCRENGELKGSRVLELLICWVTNAPVNWIEVAEGRMGFRVD